MTLFSHFKIKKVLTEISQTTVWSSSTRRRLSPISCPGSKRHTGKRGKKASGAGVAVSRIGVQLTQARKSTLDCTTTLELQRLISLQTRRKEIFHFLKNSISRQFLHIRRLAKFKNISLESIGQIRTKVFTDWVDPWWRKKRKNI